MRSITEFSCPHRDDALRQEGAARPPRHLAVSRWYCDRTGDGAVGFTPRDSVTTPQVKVKVKVTVADTPGAGNTFQAALLTRAAETSRVMPGGAGSHRRRGAGRSPGLCRPRRGLDLQPPRRRPAAPQLAAAAQAGGFTPRRAGWRAVCVSATGCAAAGPVGAPPAAAPARAGRSSPP